MHDGIVLLVAASSTKEAEGIAKTLVEERLVACVNILPPMHSLFHWKGELCRENEVLLVLKSRQRVLKKIVRRVKELHSYEVPEIIALPVIGGSEDYITWIQESIS